MTARAERRKRKWERRWFPVYKMLKVVFGRGDKAKVLDPKRVAFLAGVPEHQVRRRLGGA